MNASLGNFYPPNLALQTCGELETSRNFQKFLTEL